MLYAAILCNCLAAVLFILAAVKYGSGPVPLTYHRLILEAEGTALSPHTALILKALYRGLAGALLAIAVAIITLSMGPIRAGAFWAEILLLVMGCVFVASSTLTPHNVENQTGVQTPWRLSLLMGGLLAAGFVFAQLA